MPHGAPATCCSSTARWSTAASPTPATDRFRRALIGHYIEGAAEQVAQFYHPALRMDGTPLELDDQRRAAAPAASGSSATAQLTVEMAGIEAEIRKHE